MIETKMKLEYNRILEMLADYAVSDGARERCLNLTMEMDEVKCRARMLRTTEARKILDGMGIPPLGGMHGMEEIIHQTASGGCLSPEQLGIIETFLVSVRRMAGYLKRAEYLNTGLASYSGSFCDCTSLAELIEESIRNNQVDDRASAALKRIRNEIEDIKDRIRDKMEQYVRTKKSCLADSFVVQRNGHYVLPVRKDCKSQIEGIVYDRSASGSTVFIEPAAVGRLNSRLYEALVDEENEVRRILYELTGRVEEHLEEIKTNMDLMCGLDFEFAKARLSAGMNAGEVKITTDRHIAIVQGRHPLLAEDECVPLDFSMYGETRGVVITGPNTGGKTVALKTVGLLSMMAQSGLHVPVKEGSIFCMFNCILCDIGDGQNLDQNLSTFSAHIKRINYILGQITDESLVLLDELGSGTDPAEGMGIAAAILEALRRRRCMFAATTHYPEIKEYADQAEGLTNARMLFDKESLKPLYKLEIGTAGESCALFIARRLGFPEELLEIAKAFAYRQDPVREHKPLVIPRAPEREKKASGIPAIKKQKEIKAGKKINLSIGDSVMVYPNKEKGIVFREADDMGDVIVQIQGRKRKVSYKRIELLVKAEELYPSDYDLSIVFDTVENRKARHVLDKRYDPEAAVVYKKGEEI